MPEDDFDIYGEDEGFTTKGQVVSFPYAFAMLVLVN